MLGKKYIQIDGLRIPNPRAFSIGYENIETVNISEAGTELVQTTRLQKRTFSLELYSSSFWRNKYKEICKKQTSTLVLEDESILVRCRITGEQLLENSELVGNTNGLWIISLELVEI